MTEEEFRVIDNPSERCVQEAVFAVDYKTGDVALINDVVEHLAELVSVSMHDARRRVMAAIADDEVGVTATEDGFDLWLDPVTEARIERRYNYWVLHKQGSDGFHPHVANEDWHARCGLRQWTYDHDGNLPTWDELVDAICELLGSECSRSGGKHIALNALDAGAIYMTAQPTRMLDVRFDLDESDQPEGLGW